MTRILFIELLGGIGDLVLALPAIHALARTHAPAHMTVLTFAPAGALLRTDPHVQRVVHPGGSARDAVAAILDGGFDLVVSDTCYDDIPALLRERGPARVVENLWRDPPPDERIDLRFLRLLVADGLIDPGLARLPPRLYLTAEEVDGGRRRLTGSARPAVLLVAEAGMRIKQWPVDQWRLLSKTLHSEFGAGVVAVSGADPELAAAAVGGVGLVLPRLPLRDVTAVAAAADVCVAADTGLARLAAAVGTPTVCLFGPTVSGRFGLREEGHRSLDSPLPCPVRNPANMTEQSCWYSGRCVYDDRTSCMDDIPVAAVTAAVRSLLEAR
jgi:ADP-heptose:LPS heptosyltransferase